MASLQDVETALRNADAAGDADAARALAAEVVRLRGSKSDYPDVGRAGALAIGAGKGLSANFGDELSGLNAASGSPIPGILSGPVPWAVGAARMGYETLTGKPGAATDAYEQERERVRANIRAAEQQYPGTTLTGEVVGSAVIPAGGAARGATLGARMRSGAAAGSAFGAAAGAGEGTTPEERVKGAAFGGAVGGVVGGVAPPVVEGVIQAGRVIGAPVINAVRGIADPTGEAARRTTRALEHDINVDPAATGRLTPNEYAATPDARLIDMGGETTRGLARSSANTSPPGRFLLNDEINPRYEAQAPRLTQWMRGAFNFPNADAQQQAIDQTSRAVNNAAYARARRDGAQGVGSPELERLAESDAVVAAMRTATAKARDEAIANRQGFYGSMNPRVTFTPDGRIEFNRGATGAPNYPGLEYWDLVRRELSAVGETARRSGNDTEARRISSLARAMNEELDRLVPSYQQARQGAAAFFGAENALEAGQNYVLQNFANAATRRTLASMSPVERQLFQDGFVSRYIETLEKAGDRRNVLNQIADNPAAREKIEIALGPQRARELEARLRVEGIMDFARTAIQGNSTTTRQLVELGLAGGVGGGQYLTSGDPSSIVSAMLVWGALRGQRAIGQGIDQRVAEQVARMLTSRDPQVLQRGIQLVARQNRLMDSLRAVDRRIAVTGGEQSGSNAPMGQISPAPQAQLPAPVAP